MISELGDRIPPTFAGDRLKNTEGFTWYVSQHYALKSDFPAERAKHYLTLLELAYPKLVQMFGREPTGIDQKRMAVVYAKDKQTLAQALATCWPQRTVPRKSSARRSRSLPIDWRRDGVERNRNGEGLEIARKDALTWLREAKRHTFWKGRHQI